ncbi:MAG: transglycosylase domain-containing protein, partial [Rhodobacterales bacterium]|nr:transglycosylase domain-containing protein [Rhodobacterales bacterium]
MTDKDAEKPAAKAAGAPRKRKPKVEDAAPERLPRWRIFAKWALRGLGGIAAVYAVLILLFSFAPPPINAYQLGEAWRLGGIEKDWVSWDEIAPVVGRSAVAAEDANFCNHWGFDMAAIREAI